MKLIMVLLGLIAVYLLSGLALNPSSAPQALAYNNVVAASPGTAGSPMLALAARGLTPALLEGSKVIPTGKVKLGDPAESPEWGQDPKWGIVENFDHSTHVKPEYAEKCESCHHTNKDLVAVSATEANQGVPKCISCHFAPGNEKNPKNKAGDEITVEIAYHGNPDNLTNNAGCIECHNRFNEKTGKKSPTKCAECHVRK